MVDKFHHKNEKNFSLKEYKTWTTNSFSQDLGKPWIQDPFINSRRWMLLDTLKKIIQIEHIDASFPRVSPEDLEQKRL